MTKIMFKIRNLVNAFWSAWLADLYEIKKLGEK